MRTGLVLLPLAAGCPTPLADTGDTAEDTATGTPCFEVEPLDPRYDSTTQAFDFGDVPVGTGADQANFRVYNTCASGLDVFAEEITTTAGGVFGIDLREDLDGPFPRAIAAGSFVWASFGFAPAAAGATTGYLTITTGDPFEPELVIDLRGNGI